MAGRTWVGPLVQNENQYVMAYGAVVWALERPFGAGNVAVRSRIFGEVGSVGIAVHGAIDGTDAQLCVNFSHERFASHGERL